MAEVVVENGYKMQDDGVGGDEEEFGDEREGPQGKIDWDG